MKKLKVYLAKSNRCDFELVSKVRNYLKRFSQIELLEWVGGEYTDAEIKLANVIIFVTENPATYHDNYFVGKGLHKQLDTFVKSKKVEDPLANAFVVNSLDENLYLDNITDYCINDANDWVSKYGSFDTDGMAMNMWSLEAFPSKYYEYKDEILEKPNQNLLLICNF